jgi:hypothetical protein
MPIETIVVVAFILAVFAGFAAVLAWADHHTSSLPKRSAETDTLKAPEAQKAAKAA